MMYTSEAYAMCFRIIQFSNDKSYCYILSDVTFGCILPAQNKNDELQGSVQSWPNSAETDYLIRLCDKKNLTFIVTYC